jgi:ribosomal protein S18 acetylase RimI-like enzyme
VPTLSINIAAEPTSAERDAVLTGLRAYNRLHAPAPGWLALTILLQDDDQQIFGGLVGKSGWDWLHVEFLWVAHQLQRQGFGRALLERAESEARARGCRGVHLDTHNFQAPGFYERMGYTEFGVLDEYPAGFKRHFMYKHLAEQSPRAL